MKLQHLLLALTLVNLGLLAFPLLARAAPVLRGRALQLVDEQGRVRASLNVLPAGTSQAGDAYPETVLLRLITERGRPSVNISASEEAAGLCLVGPTGTQETYVIPGNSGWTKLPSLHT